MDDDDKKILKKIKAKKKESFKPNPWLEIKKKIILDAYIRNDGNSAATARELGISRVQMWRYKKEYGLN
ncbi:helix-turn-helix domain-containing protein [Sapientia aquatica]|nr:helix-turn-helix domain-containing protein [Sapientia aquatica]